MVRYLEDKYISLLTDFGFKRVFGTEPNKGILIDFLNVLLPAHHQIRDLTFKNNENIGNTVIDRKAIFDIYCQAESGERFIVEIQKAKQNFFKDRSVYYSTFPIQEQVKKGPWNFELSSVYTVGILDFIFDDHKDDDTIVHVVQLRNQNCQLFYDKLQFIYIELPKFKKTIDQLETHLDKWIYILRHLENLSDPPPEPLQETAFNELFEVATIANFSRIEQDGYENSLKYYRDMNNVVDTSRQEGVKQGIEFAELRFLDRQRTSLLRLLPRRIGDLPNDLIAQINTLSLEQIEILNEVSWDFTELNDLVTWLETTE